MILLCRDAQEPVGFELELNEACASNSKCCGPLDRLLKLRCAEKNSWKGQAIATEELAQQLINH
jgi:hypothetical protein